jgi:hypothetical protein
MNRFARAGACALLLASTGLHAGCGNSSAGLMTGSTGLLPADAPTAVKNEDPMARPVGVAWTSARAKRCGFYFDPAKLKTNYLTYESRQGAAGEQISLDADYCSDRKGLEIKADLERHLAGDYTPNLPKPKPIASCGFWGCTSSGDQPFSDKKFWADQEKNNPKK